MSTCEALLQTPCDNSGGLAVDPETQSFVQLWPELPGTWYVLHVKPRQEKLLAADMKARGLSVYLPLIEQTRLNGHRKTKAMLPLFPGYMFLKGEREDAYTADRTNRLVGIIDVPDQEALAWELASVEQMLASGASIAEMRAIEIGTPVEVRTGPFKGQQGLVESLSKAHRLIVQVSSLGRALSVELDASVVEPLSAEL